MKMDITYVDVWAASLKDRPGELALTFEALAHAGANLEFIIARRSPDQPGTGVVFVTPFKGKKQIDAAKQAGFDRSKSLQVVRVGVTDKPGLASQMTRQIANAGINLRACTGALIGRRSVFHLAFDSSEDAQRAVESLMKMP